MAKENIQHTPWYKKWWFFLILGLIIGGALGSANNNQEFKYCAERCVYDLDDCVFALTPLTSQNILYDDYEECSSDLESCIEDCNIE